MKALARNIWFLICNRFIAFLIFFGTFLVIQAFLSVGFLPTTDVNDLWFYSGLFMIVFSILFIEPYYTSPKNVITNVIPLLLVFLAVKSSFILPVFNPAFWWIAFSVLLLLLIISITAIAVEDKNQSPAHVRNHISEILKKVAVFLGRGRVLYSAVFLYFLLASYSIQSFYVIVLFILWFAILAIDPQSMHNSFTWRLSEESKNELGEIFGIQSKKIFLAKLNKDQSVKKFDLVKFKYAVQDSEEFPISGIIFDTYLLNQERWIKILQLSSFNASDKTLKENVVYKISDDEEKASLNKKLKVEGLVGVVIEGSTIGKIKFEYSKKTDDLQEGDLLELEISGQRRLFYQVISGRTEKERLENRNETGFIEGEAVQLGEWQTIKSSFKKFGWVPSVNTPVFRADTSNITAAKISYPKYKVGSIPGTSLPAVIDLNDAISHHMALLGVTGSGKSFLARDIIGQINKDTKVICVDFNKEFVAELKPAPLNIISDQGSLEVTKRIDWISNELEKFPNLQDKSKIFIVQGEIRKILRSEIEAFLDDKSCNTKVFELPDVSNTAGIFDYTKYFFKVLFEIAKERQASGRAMKICVVLEEAHTIIPEWNFSGTNDKSSQSLVNSIGQIALQGRKYGVGFVVIAQRTANVSKTILTQCNTVICFQAFDETSFTFLSNYVGEEMVRALPNLKQYHAIIAGKAVQSNVPMIIDLKR